MRRIALLTLAAAMGLYAWDANEDLLDASRKGDLAAVQALVAKGAALETKTGYGQTPLYLAAMNGREDVVRFLLEKGANPEIHDTFYEASMLDFVLIRKYYGVAKLLIRKLSANPDGVLSSVVRTGDAGLVATFLESGRPTQPALDKAYAAALDGKQPGVAAELKKAGASEPAPAATVDVATLQSYAGTYSSEQLPVAITASVKDGKLYLQATGQSEFAVKPRSATLFEFAPAHMEVEFDTPASFTLRQGGASFHFKKAVTQ